ncbi:MAG: c-type cytochrome [Alphaproteobacteria bacterium]|nr:c-type cytochrome [Alphaproteobacteria bacterium]
MLRCIIVAAALVAPALAQAQSNAALIEKGRALFSDPALSADGRWSCATCHPANGHTDNKTYVGLDVVADGDARGRSTPTLWGSGIRTANWSWAGTIPAIETNIRGIIVNRMKGAEPSKETLEALAAYVKSLPPGPAPFLNAEGPPRDTAPADVKRGFAVFSGKGGCMTCHVPAAYDKKDPEDVGSGGAFKVPSLRSVSRTGPWFHDGRYATLEATVDAMWDFYKKKNDSKDTLSDAEKRDLVAFLRAL